MYTYEEAVNYFETEVLHNQPWLDAEETTRKRALKNAENILYETFTGFNSEKKPLPAKAIYEQALWLLRQDDNVRQAEMGITNINLSGELSISMSQNQTRIAPSVKAIIRSARGKVGRYL